jgi:hypothetical protein
LHRQALPQRAVKYRIPGRIRKIREDDRIFFRELARLPRPPVDAARNQRNNSDSRWRNYFPQNIFLLGRGRLSGCSFGGCSGSDRSFAYRGIARCNSDCAACKAAPPLNATR